jgi:hypothetical protein
MKTVNALSVNPSPRNDAVERAHAPSAEQLLAALQAHSTEISAKALPGPKAKAKYNNEEGDYDEVKAHSFEDPSKTTWFAISHEENDTENDTYFRVYTFYSKNDVPAGTASEQL